MEWFHELLFEKDSIAHAVMILGAAAALGLALGSVKIFKVSLGVAGVLFAGLILGHFGLGINDEILHFARDFGLILFVYTIGVQVGPGFISSLKKQGLPLNIMAASIVILGAILTLALYKMVMQSNEFSAAVGMFSGSTTNTPSLAASTQALKDAVSPENQDILKLPALGYAVTYPFGVMGIILSMLLLRVVFRVDLKKEAQALEALNGKKEEITTLHLEVTNPNVDGLKLKRVPALKDSGVVVSRVMRGDQTQVAHADTVLGVGDVMLAVGPKPALEQFKVVVGNEVDGDVDLKAVPGDIATRRILVTQNSAIGKSVHALNLGHRFGAVVTRIRRGDIEIPVTSKEKLQFGDNLTVVGNEESIDQVAKELGNSVQRLNQTQIIPIFIGIILGVILGSIPVQLPGFPAPVKLGLAGGPLIVALVLSRIGKIGPLVWHMPNSANHMLRELGIVLFLACVGLASGDRFISILTQGNGLMWMGLGAVVTVAPLLVVALIGRIFFHLNYLSMCGLLAGSMTDPPALAFAGAVTGSEAPSISYATVYPLVMLLRVLSAQAMVLFFFPH